MSSAITKEINKRYDLNFKDGLIDVFIGFILILIGLFIWVDKAWMGAIFIPSFTPAFQAARIRFLHPRLGNVSDEIQNHPPNQKVFLIITLLFGSLMLAGVGALFVFNLSGSISEWLRFYFLLLLGGVFAGVWVIAAVVLKFNHFYLYAVITFVSFSATQFTVIPFWVAFVILGGVVGFTGLFVLIRFIQDHPITY